MIPDSASADAARMAARRGGLIPVARMTMPDRTRAGTGAPGDAGRVRARSGAWLALALAFTGLLAAEVAPAQPYPTRPLRIVVPLAPGGTTDILARMTAQRLSEVLGQPVVVDNRPGGGGTIGNRIVAQAPGDGYTLLMATPTMTINPSLHRDAGYDAVRDFAPVSLIAAIPIVLAVHPAVPARSVKELIALARAKPGTLNYASSGSGGGPHLSAALFADMAGIDIVHVPYKGSGPALTDLLGGQVQMQFSGLPPLIAFIRSGRLHALAVGGVSRSSALPDVPTVAEAGLPGYDAASWQGIALPASAPKRIVDLLAGEIARFVATTEARTRLAELGAEPVGGTPQAFAAFVRAEVPKWAQVIRRAGARAD